MRAALAALALLLLGSTPSAAQFGPVSGRFIRYDGTPLSGETVVLSGEGRNTYTTTTGPDGEFSFEQIESGKPALLQVNAAGVSQTPFELGPLVALGDVGIFVLQPGRRTPPERPRPLSARIIDTSGNRAARATVAFLPWRTPGPACLLQTDATGAFVFPARPHAEYRVYVIPSVRPTPQLQPGARYVGTIVSARHDIDLGRIVLRRPPANPGPQRDGAGPPIGDIAGPVRIASSPDNFERIAAMFCGSAGITVIHEDARTVRPPKQKQELGCTDLKISTDRTAAGWLVDSEFCCASYPLPFFLAVYRPGKPLSRFTGDGRAIFDWAFVGAGARVATYQDFPHGVPARHYELRDVDSGRLVARWDRDLTPQAPSWTKGLQH